jgi:altronate dehydratase
VIKVATRDDLARRWHDLMDINAGKIATGSATIEDIGWELFHMMLDVASGKKPGLNIGNSITLWSCSTRHQLPDC